MTYDYNLLQSLKKQYTIYYEELRRIRQQLENNSQQHKEINFKIQKLERKILQLHSTISRL